jgi:GT2 family glycosyltransferase
MPDAPPTNPWLPPEFTPGLISVVIPTYNRSELVVQTVRSVFAQTYRPLEVIVGDDASTDDTVARLRMWDPPFGVTLQVFGGEKVGACPLRNRGAAMSRGEYIMFLDSDDLLTSPALAQLAVAIQGHDMAWGPWRDLRTQENVCTLSAPFTRSFSKDWLVELLHGQWIATCSVMYRRSALARVAGWREDTVLDGDFHFNAQLGAAGATLADSAGVTSYYRRGGSDQISEQNYLTKMEHTHRVLLALEQSLDERDAWTDARRAAVAARYFHSARMVWFRTGNVGRFAELISEARRVDPAFRPQKSWYRWISAVAGYPNAERVAAIGRKLFR